LVVFCFWNPLIQVNQINFIPKYKVDRLNQLQLQMIQEFYL
jgi:hypothetical protein